MADSSNSYTANALQVQNSAAAIEQIGATARKILADFANDVSGTRSWPGIDDSYFKQASPQEKQETETVTSTAQTLTEAIAAVAAGTGKNASSILTAQAGTLDAIHTAGSTSDGTTGTTGRH